MSIDAGSLDRRVTLRMPAKTRSASGAEVQTFSDLATVWARVTQKASAEVYSEAGERIVPRSSITVLIRWRGDFTALGHVVHGARTWRVVSPPREVGRKEGLEFEAESLEA